MIEDADIDAPAVDADDECHERVTSLDTDLFADMAKRCREVAQEDAVCVIMRSSDDGPPTFLPNWLRQERERRKNPNPVHSKSDQLHVILSPPSTRTNQAHQPFLTPKTTLLAPTIPSPTLAWRRKGLRHGCQYRVVHRPARSMRSSSSTRPHKHPQQHVKADNRMHSPSFSSRPAMTTPSVSGKHGPAYAHARSSIQIAR